MTTVLFPELSEKAIAALVAIAFVSPLLVSAAAASSHDRNAAPAARAAARMKRSFESARPKVDRFRVAFERAGRISKEPLMSGNNLDDLTLLRAATLEVIASGPGLLGAVDSISTAAREAMPDLAHPRTRELALGLRRHLPAIERGRDEIGAFLEKLDASGLVEEIDRVREALAEAEAAAYLARISAPGYNYARPEYLKGKDLVELVDMAREDLIAKGLPLPVEPEYDDEGNELG